MTIGVSIPSYKPGKPVTYEIIVSLGDESKAYSVFRRYNEFLKLAQDVESEMGEPVTVAPPKKPSIWESVDYDQRRIDLEIMLKALVRVPEFAECLAVGQFLEVYARKKEARPTAHSVDWMHTTSEISRLIAETRNPLPPAQTRQRVIQAKALVGQLQRELTGPHASKLGEGELARRQQHLDHYLMALRKVESSTSAYPGSIGAFPEPDTPRVLGETEETRKLNNMGLLQHQQNTIEDQDDLVEGLRAAVSRQKELGLAVHSEIVKQNELLDDLDADVHRVNARLNEARRKTAHLNR